MNTAHQYFEVGYLWMCNAEYDNHVKHETLQGAVIYLCSIFVSLLWGVLVVLYHFLLSLSQRK